MKKFCISLREHATNEINFEKKKMQPLSKKSTLQHITFVEKDSQKRLLKIKIIEKLETMPFYR